MMDLNAILLALPALRHLPDALLLSSAFVVGWNLFLSIEKERVQ